MISHLTGTIIAQEENTLVIDIHGVGYGVTVSTYTQGKVASKQEISFFIYTHVREQEITLYGFLSSDERTLFQALLTISGVGPKAAINILSIADAQTILTSIAQEDSSLLIKVSGIGKKTANRIVLELQNKVKKLIAALPADKKAIGTIDTDAIDALMSMGYSVVEARDALSAISENMKDMDLSTQVKESLKYLGKKR